MDRAEIDIAAPPEAVYDLVADVTNMGRWSPECRRCEWIDGATSPAVGARLKGWNQGKAHGIPVRWTTVSTVRQADHGKAFSFETKDSGARWTYSFEATPTGCHVVETREDSVKPLLAKVFGFIVGPANREAAQVDGMHATLQRLKAAAESAA
ncbi:MAG TPA: SRPBCC family protein [Acidimicrobiales bacterium]